MQVHRVALNLSAALAALMAVNIPLAEAQDATAKPVTVDNTRDMRFCEILVAKETGVEVYNTTGVSDCPAELWNALDTASIQSQYGAQKVEKNGPHFWMMDSQTVAFGEEVTLGGIKARWAATLDPTVFANAAKGSEPYKVFTPKKTQKMIYAKGKPAYELVDPDGNVYVLQAHEEQFPLGSLDKLGEHLKLPDGWKFQVQTPTEDLILDLTEDQTTYAIGDEFHQYWMRIPAAK